MAHRRARGIAPVLVLLLAGSASAAPQPTSAPSPEGPQPLFILLDRSFFDSEMRLKDRMTRGAFQAVRSCATVRPVAVVAYEKGLKVFAEATANEAIQERAVEEAMGHGQIVEGKSRFLDALREAGGPSADGLEASLKALSSAIRAAHGSGEILLLGFRMDLFRLPRPHPQYLEAVQALADADIRVYAVDYSSSPANPGFLDLAEKTGGVADGSNIPGEIPGRILETLCGR